VLSGALHERVHSQHLNQWHLFHGLGEFERFYNEHRRHQGIANARPLYPLPMPSTDPDEIARLGGIVHEYEHAA
jgi:hypothetical protein